MSARLPAALLTAVALLTPPSAQAMDDYLRASSGAPTGITLCGEANGDGTRIKTAACKEAGYDTLVAAIDKSFASALARSPAIVRPLFKRDEAWFNEMILEAADTVQETGIAELREEFVKTLRKRAAVLDELARGFGRAGFAGQWANAFGSVTLTPSENGAYRLAVDMSAYYGSDKHRQCKLSLVVSPTTGGWLGGSIPPDPARTTDGADQGNAADDKDTRPVKLPSIKLRRQGDTLRVVMIDGDERWSNKRDDCDYMWQITGSYFASGKSDITDKADTSFVTPTFDCMRPETATDEEICSDPDLVENDQRLNRAWKALWPRLDDTTRHALMDDQRHWVQSQAQEFPEFLHPAWEKHTSEMHFTAYARDQVDALQRERIALLEGFDDKRVGLAGVWLAYNAIIKVAVSKDGSLEAAGWKWDQGDWKAGCDYGMKGKVVGGVFRSDEKRKNPDTLERDHAMLVVNRLDDVFAPKRTGNDGENADEEKCKRRLDRSSTARLFPARPSPDINDFGHSIR